MPSGDFMIISGFQKLTLLDFPGHTACTLFTHGCNMRCPFCHNSSLVSGQAPEIHTEDEILSFLKKRQGLLDGVAITGGEPLLHKDIGEFIKKIKALGFSVKLDTNGSIPERLEELISGGLVDYIAMDIKNCREKYSLSAGTDIDIKDIERSVELIKNSSLPHEFRTTVTRELHTENDIISVAKWLGKEEKYFLQQFKDSGDILSDGQSAHEDEALRRFALSASEFVKLCETRGI